MKAVEIYNLVTLEKVFFIICALSLIQILGSIASKIFGLRDGAVIAGFISGVISSTAATAALAKQSYNTPDENLSILVISFFSAALAMLLEIVFLLFVGFGHFHSSFLALFIMPVCANLFFIIFNVRKTSNTSFKIEHEHAFKFSSILKLTLFIVIILLFSKILSQYFGDKGLFLFSFFVSLFEIHGSIVANVQLYEAGAFSEFILGTLVFLSTAAAFISKIFLVYTLGNKKYQSKILLPTMVIILSLVLSWLAFSILVK